MANNSEVRVAIIRFLKKLDLIAESKERMSDVETIHIAMEEVLHGDPAMLDGLLEQLQKQSIDRFQAELSTKQSFLDLAVTGATIITLTEFRRELLKDMDLSDQQRKERLELCLSTEKLYVDMLGREVSRWVMATFLKPNSKQPGFPNPE